MTSPHASAAPLPTPGRGPLVAAIVVGLATVALSLGAFAYAWRQDELSLERRFHLRSENAQTYLQLSLDRMIERLVAMQVLFENSAAVDREEFAEAARRLRGRDATIQAFQWVPVVRGAERRALEARARADGLEDFVIRRIEPGAAPQPAPPADEYWPITYIEPLAGNRPALGFDLLHGPTTAVLTAARDTGRLQISPPFRLVQETAQSAGLVFVLPVRRPTPDGETTHLGWVQAVLRAVDLFRPLDTLAETNQLEIAVAMIDPADATRRLPLHRAAAQPAPAPRPRLAHDGRFELGGRTLLLEVRPTTVFLRSHRSKNPFLVLLAGLFASAILTTYLVRSARHAAETEALVARRTAQLRATNDQLAEQIAHRVRAEQATESARARYELLVNSVDGIVWEADPATDRFTFVSRRAETLLGYPVSAWLEDPHFWETHLHPEDRDAAVNHWREALRTGQPFVHTYRLVTADGHAVWLEDRAEILCDSEGRVTKSLGLMLDITAHRRAEDNLARSALLLANVREAIVVTDLAGIVTEWNTGAEQLFGWRAAEVVGRPYVERYPPQIAEEIAANIARIAEGAEWLGEWLDFRKDGTRVWVESRVRRFHDSTGRPAGVLALSHDITERKRRAEDEREFERRMQETARLESLGVLAGGIAHDFNNLLTGMLGHASLARLDAPTASPLADSLAAIEAAAVRAADLCRQMLAYAGRSQLYPRALNLDELLRDNAELFRASAGRRVILEVVPSTAPLPSVLADPAQLRQVILNLIVNAAEAVGDRAGQIRLSTGVAELDRGALDDTPLGLTLPAGPYVWCEVHDNGTGMPPEVQQRIFEPFFTTKFTGRGLGLAAVLGIVRAHEGTLSVASTPGRGTTIRVYLPIAPAIDPAPGDPATPAAPAPRPAPARVLVIDDEDLVRHTLGRILSQAGHEVATAPHGQAGLEELRRPGAAYDLVLLDLTMPVLDGRGTLESLRSHGPPVRLVLMSGFTEEEAARRFAARGAHAFLQKPFTADTLLTAVATALNGLAPRLS